MMRQGSKQYLRGEVKALTFRFCHGKPVRPKEAAEAALRKVRRPRSSNIYRKLAEVVSLQLCTDPAFLKLKSILQNWFPAGNRFENRHASLGYCLPYGHGHFGFKCSSTLAMALISSSPQPWATPVRKRWRMMWATGTGAPSSKAVSTMNLASLAKCFRGKAAG